MRSPQPQACAETDLESTDFKIQRTAVGQRRGSVAARKAGVDADSRHWRQEPRDVGTRVEPDRVGFAADDRHVADGDGNERWTSFSNFDGADDVLAHGEETWTRGERHVEPRMHGEHQ